MACLHGGVGAAHGPVCPQRLRLFALRRGQIGAGIQPQKDRIEADVVLGVVKQPGVLHFKAGRSGRAMQKVVVLDAIQVIGGVSGVTDCDIEAGDALNELDVGFKLAANVGRDLGELVEGFSVAVA